MKRLTAISMILALFALVSGTATAESRIVSADGSITEIIYALNQQHRLVGVDTTSSYPPAAQQLPQIGYKRNLAAEGILSLGPQQLLASEDSGPDDIIDQIASAGVMVSRFSAEPTLAALEEKLKGVAKLLGEPEGGEKLWQQVQQDLARAKQVTDKVNQPLKVLFVLDGSARSPIVGGSNTHADTMIRLAGGVNVAAELRGYKPITAEALLAANPDLILAMEHGRKPIDPKTLVTQPGFAGTNAANNNRVVLMDGLYLIGFGPRTGEAVRTLVEQFYPQQLAAQ